jgi:hypothetical protein
MESTGMYCTCGKMLMDAGIDNGMRQVVCPVHPRRSYRVQLTPMNTIEKRLNKSWFGSTVP